MLRREASRGNLVNVGRSRTHYEVLGVDRNASTAELRRAHRDLARVLHPDLLTTVQLSAEDRLLAEQRIREVNEAWRVLGDSGRRSRYDVTLGDEAPDASWSPFPSGTPDAPDGWDRASSRPVTVPRTNNVRVIQRNESPPKPFHGGVLVGFGVIVLLGVLLVVLLAGQGGGGVAPPAASSGSCVRVQGGPKAVVVPCTTPNDGRIVAFAPDPSGCPPGANARRLAAEDAELACLEPTGGR